MQIVVIIAILEAVVIAVLLGYCVRLLRFLKAQQKMLRMIEYTAYGMIALSALKFFLPGKNKS